MKSTKLKTKTEKGITLIALIITIVVLMILAAVAINSITNDGIISQAGSTANKYNQAVKDEESYLQDYEDMLTAANGGYATYEVGREVTVAGEPFYVIEDKTSLGKVVLLAKGNIDTETLVQDGEDNYIAFSETNYWHSEDIPVDEDGFFYNERFDITETGVPDESHYAARAAYEYGLKIGGKGRLMTISVYEELYEKGLVFQDETSYWLGTASAFELINNVEEGFGDADYHGREWYEDYFGVRPVVEISKSKIQ